MGDSQRLESSCRGKLHDSPPLPSDVITAYDDEEPHVTDGRAFKHDATFETYAGKQALFYPSGDRYEGDVVAGLRHGHGRMEHKSGFIYEGSWRDDHAEGQGMGVYPNGARYKGEWVHNQRCGWGMLEAPDNQGTYEGEWRDDVPHGRGIWTFHDHSFFEGTYELGARKHGKLVSANGKQVYTGSFKDGLQDGEGLLVIQGLLQHSGHWEKGVRCGYGECRFADGTVYKGQWQNDKQEGQGDCRYSGGDIYHGEFFQGLRQGQGTCIYASGDKYHGQWQADQCSGQGACKYANGDCYKGSWANSKRHGTGTMLFKDGSKFYGQWEEGEWVQTSAEPRLCRVAGPGLSRAVAGSQATFIIEARDVKGNKRLSGGDEFSVKLAGPCEVCAQVQDLGDGRYQVFYSTTRAGVYELHVMTDDEHIAESPYVVRVAAAMPCAKKSTLLGAGRSHATCGVTASFQVEARDQYGNRCEDFKHAQLAVQVNLTDGHGKEVPVVLEPCQAGYSCSYCPAELGYYRLQACSGAVHLAGSPFSLLVLSDAITEGLSPQTPAGMPTRALADFTTKQVADLWAAWQQRAWQQYTQDGSADGWDADEDNCHWKDQTPEQAYIKAHQGVPVVERLEDLWKISKVKKMLHADGLLKP